jgi:hypothetical protein
MRERVLEEILLVEDGDCFGTDCAGCTGERGLGGDDAICLTVAVCGLVCDAISLPEWDLNILTAANEQLPVVDNRLSSDSLADGFGQLDNAFLSAT